MTWVDWALVVTFMVGTVATIASVGKDRQPITPGLAAFTAVVNMVFCIALLAARGAL